MDKDSELLMRAALHDLANVLAGVQGVLDLTPEDAPLSPRNRARLDAVVSEGLGILGRARHLAMGTLPDASLQSAREWREQLADELKPLALLHKAPLEVELEPGPGPDAFPGEALRTYVRSACRQVLPYARSGLRIQARSEADHWRLRMAPVSQLPEGLCALPEGRSGDIAGRWALRVAQALDIAVAFEDGGLTIRIPRP
ncbi:MAG TPA: hypothetical protein VK188_13700 [Holophaga sp.]|nr:hypothetical protein [Holophaga sp.]